MMFHAFDNPGPPRAPNPSSTTTPRPTRAREIVFKLAKLSGFKPSSNAQPIPIHKLDLFSQRNKIDADTTLAKLFSGAVEGIRSTVASVLHDIGHLLAAEQAGPAPSTRARTLRPAPKHPKARRRHSGHPVPPL